MTTNPNHRANTGLCLSLAAALALGLAGQAILLQGPGLGRWLAQLSFLNGSVRAFLSQHSLMLGLALYAWAVLLLIVIFARHGSLATNNKPQPTTRWELAILVCILLLALVLQVYRWQEVPPGVHVDEAINGLNALGITVRDHNTIYFENSDGREILMPYLIALSFRLFGIGLFAFKLVPLAVALLTIAMIYLLGRELFNSQVGLLAAFLMAVSKWHLVISRVTHEAVPVPLLTTLVAFFLVRALRRGNRWDYLACGVALGLGMYTYPAFRVMPFAVAIYVLGRSILERGFVPRHFTGLAAAASTALAVFAPFGLYMKDHWEMFSQRMRVTSFYMDPNYDGHVLSTLWANTLKSLTMLYTNSTAVYYLPNDTVLDLVSIVLFTLGLFYCLWFWRRRQNALLLVWFAAGLLPSVLSHAVRLPHALRTASLIPLAPLLVAVMVWYLWQAFQRTGISRAVLTALLAALLILIATLNLSTYFKVYAHDPRVYDAFDPMPNEAARAINELSQKYDVFVMPLIAEHSSFRLLTYGRSRYRWLNANNVVGIQGTLSRDVVCVFSPFDVERYQDRLARLCRNYPQGVLTEYRSPHGGLLYSTYLVRKEDIVNIPDLGGEADWGRDNAAALILYTVSGPQHGLVGWYYQDQGEGPMWLSAPRMVRVDQGIRPGDWMSANFAFSIIWWGQINIPADGEYIFGTESPDGSWVDLDGQLVVDNGGHHPLRYAEGKITLSQGRHDLEVRYFFEKGRPQMELYWVPPGGPKEIVPPAVLYPVVSLPMARAGLSRSWIGGLATAALVALALGVWLAWRVRARRGQPLVPVPNGQALRWSVGTRLKEPFLSIRAVTRRLLAGLETRSTIPLVMALASGIAAQIALMRSANIIGLVFYALSAVMMGLVLLRREPGEEGNLSRWAEWGLLAVIVTVGIFLRLWQIDAIPPGMHYDETINGLNALGILKRQSFPVYFTWDGAGREPLLMYLIAGSVAVLGPTVLALKLPSIITGVLTVVLVHLTARRAFNVRVGLLSAFLLAFSSWHIILTRTAYEAVLVPFAVMLVLYTVARAIDTNRWPDWALGGVALGLGMYCYPAYRPVTLAVAIFLLYRLATDLLSRRDLASPGPALANWKFLRGLVIYILAALVVFAPLGLYIRANWAAYVKRVAVTSFQVDPSYTGDTLAALWHNTKLTLSMFYTTRVATLYSLSGETIADFASTVLFTLGFFYCLWRWRRGYNLLFILSTLLLLLPSILSHASRLPHAFRTSGEIPLAAIFAAVALYLLAQRVASLASSQRRIVALALVAVALLGIGYANYDRYFNRYRASPWINGSFYPEVYQIARQVLDAQDCYRVYLMPIAFEHITVQFLTYGRAEYFDLTTSNGVGFQGEQDKDILCILPLADRARAMRLLDRLRAAYPRGTYQERRNYDGGVAYITYVIRKEDMVSVAGADAGRNWKGEDTSLPVLYTVPKPEHGLTARYYRDHVELPMWLGAPETVRIDPGVTLGSYASLSYPFSVIWRGQIEAPEAGEYAFGTESLDGSWVSVDGRLVADNGGHHPLRYTEGKITLSKGRHDLEVRYFSEKGKPQIEFYWTLPGRTKQIVSSAALYPVASLPMAKAGPPWNWAIGLLVAALVSLGAWLVWQVRARQGQPPVLTAEGRVLRWPERGKPGRFPSTLAGSAVLAAWRRIWQSATNIGDLRKLRAFFRSLWDSTRQRLAGLAVKLPPQVAALTSGVAAWLTPTKTLLLLLIAVGAGLMAQGLLARREHLTVAVIAYALGTVLTIFALSRGVPKSQEPPGVDEVRRGNLRSTVALLLAALALSLVALWLFGQSPPSQAGLLCYGAGIFLAVYAFVKEEGLPLRSFLKSLPSVAWARRGDLALLAVILGVGAFLRFYQLETVPVGLYGDEANNGLEAINVLKGLVPLPFGVGWGDNPMLFFYVIALSFRLFGISVFALKLVFVLSGILAIAALYLLARELFDPKTALLAASLLAISRWHIHFSRWAMQAVAITLWEMVAFYFLARGLRTRRNWGFVWCAVTLVLCLNTYAAARIVPVVFAVYVLYRVFERGFLARHYQGILALTVIFVLLFAPFAQYFVRNPQEFLRRSEEVSILRSVRAQASLKPLADSVVKTLLMFNYQGDANGRHNLSNEPMLNFFVSIFFVFGLGYSLWRWRDHRHFLLSAWFFLTLLTGFLSIEAPHAHRTLGVAPVAVLFAALFLGKVWQAGKAVLGRRGEWLFAAGAAVLMLVIAASEYDKYFNKMNLSEPVWSAFSSDATVAARQINDFSDKGYYVYVSYPYAGAPPVEFMTYGRPPWQRFDLVDTLPSPQSQGDKVAYVLSAGYESLSPALQRYYPQGEFRRIPDPFNRPMLIAFSAADVQAGWGLTGRYYQNETWAGEPVLTRRDTPGAFDWAATPSPLAPPFSVEWQGSLLVPQYGPYVLSLEASGRAALYLDSRLLLESQGGSAQTNQTLAKGLHAIRIRCLVTAPGGRVNLAWTPPGGKKETIPQNLFRADPVVNGLLASYYPNDRWSGTPTYAQVVPLLAYDNWGESVPKPSTVEWRGWLLAPRSGRYALSLETDDRAQLELDGQVLLDYKGDKGSQSLNAEATLTEGPHELRVRYFERRDFFRLRLWWTSPGGKREIVPPGALSPYREE